MATNSTLPIEGIEDVEPVAGRVPPNPRSPYATGAVDLRHGVRPWEGRSSPATPAGEYPNARNVIASREITA